MKNKFHNVPVDEDTNTLLSLITTFGKYEALLEKWSWDGISGDSLIFFNKDIADSTKDNIKTDIQDSDIYESGQVTVKNTEFHTFFNFNFSTE